MERYARATCAFYRQSFLLCCSILFWAATPNLVADQRCPPVVAPTHAITSSVGTDRSVAGLREFVASRTGNANVSRLVVLRKDTQPVALVLFSNVRAGLSRAETFNHAAVVTQTSAGLQWDVITGPDGGPAEFKAFDYAVEANGQFEITGTGYSRSDCWIITARKTPKGYKATFADSANGTPTGSTDSAAAERSCPQLEGSMLHLVLRQDRAGTMTALSSRSCPTCPELAYQYDAGVSPAYVAPPAGRWMAVVRSQRGVPLDTVTFDPTVYRGRQFDMIVRGCTRAATVAIVNPEGRDVTTVDVTGSRVCNDDGHCSTDTGESTKNCPTDCHR
jgi:hypothetical protein